MADREAADGRRNFIAILLKDNLSINELPREMRPYLSTHSYIDATENIDLVTKTLRYAFSNFL